jgi:hypothetical protein
MSVHATGGLLDQHGPSYGEDNDYMLREALGLSGIGLRISPGKDFSRAQFAGCPNLAAIQCTC